MTGSFDGVIAITGAARGIGFAIAEELQRHGARVAIGDIDERELAKAAASLGVPLAKKVDVTDPASFREFLAEVEHVVGPLDGLVNNAGIMPTGPFLDESDGVTKRVLDINTFGFIMGTKAALELMVPRHTGHIINIASTMGEASVPGLITYSASKAAVIRFTDAARIEFRNSGVKLSTILPGAVNTELATGVKGPRGIRNIDPQDVAIAVRRTLESGRSHSRIYLPRTFGYLLAAQRYVPRPVAELANRLMGAETAILRDSDLDSRRAYLDRIAPQ